LPVQDEVGIQLERGGVHGDRAVGVDQGPAVEGRVRGIDGVEVRPVGSDHHHLPRRGLPSRSRRRGEVRAGGRVVLGHLPLDEEGRRAVAGLGQEGILEFPRRLQVHGGADADGRSVGLALAVEDVEGIHPAFHQVQLVHVHESGFRGVGASQIDGQMVVDEHPDVVVAPELELQTGSVFEGGVPLQAEREVVLVVVGGQGQGNAARVLDGVQREEALVVVFVVPAVQRGLDER
jgi:hypothetical protein